MRKRSTRTPAHALSRPAQARASNVLASFLDQREHPAGTLAYHELQGFLFAIVTAPELVSPSEWLPEIFGGEEPEFQSVDEAQTIVPELMALYNAINESVATEPAKLPPDCQFRSTTLANLDEDAPISQWSRGFLDGYEWLQEDWDPYVPDEYDRDFAVLLLTLSFFASRTLAEAYTKETGHTDLEDMATKMREAFPNALAHYAFLGRSIQQATREHGAATERPPGPKVGRNEPCPCGSGKKYKKCCGASA